VRDLMILGMMVIIIPICLRNAFAAYLLWGWSGLIAVHTFAYGFMISFPYVLVFALISIVLLALRRDTEMLPAKVDGVGLLMIWFGLHAIACAALAYPNIARNWEITIDLQKTLLYSLLMPMLVTNRLRIHAMVLMLALSAGYHGLIEGLKFIASGGGHLSQGNPKLGDRNHFAVLVTMCLPFLLYAIWYSRSRLIRWAAAGALMVNVLSIVATQSRGGLLSLIAISVFIVMQSSRKLVGVLTIAVIGAVGLSLAPDRWSERMETIQTANEDSSFMGRVIAWKRASAIAVAHPIFGGGIRSVQNGTVFEKYRFDQGLLGWVDTPQATYAAAAHSIYFEVLGDMGFVGLFLFLAIMFSPFVMAARVRKLCREIGPSATWSRDLAFMVCAGMVGYLTGGASISAAYFELSYVLVSLAAVNYHVIRRIHAETVRARAAAAAGPVLAAAP
jgi:probable O-glycosylation ligase (exosortase A-associated)